jgi:hypothetical protein
VVREHVGERLSLPRHYFIDEWDPDAVILYRQDYAFVAAFSAKGVTREGIIEVAREDYRKLVQVPCARHVQQGEEHRSA